MRRARAASSWFRVASRSRAAGATGVASETVDIGDLREVRVARSLADRISGRQTLVLERRTGEPIRIASIVHPGIISELAEHLASQLGEEHSMSRAVVVVPLREGASRAGGRVAAQRPAVRPRGGRASSGTTCSSPIRKPCSSSRPTIPVRPSGSSADGSLWSAAAVWKDLVAGPPRLADDAYSWLRPHVPDDLSFAPTPGPGDSDGGDLF